MDVAALQDDEEGSVDDYGAEFCGHDPVLGRIREKDTDRGKGEGCYQM